MSAFICDSELFAAIGLYAASRRPGGYSSARVSPHAMAYYGGRDVSAHSREGQASYYADLLYQENLRSVQHRYPDSTWEDLPGPIDKPLMVVVVPGQLPEPFEPVEVLKACGSIEYQSCETDDYYQKPGYALLNLIRKAAVSELPGYDQAPWGSLPGSK